MGVDFGRMRFCGYFIRDVLFSIWLARQLNYGKACQRSLAFIKVVKRVAMVAVFIGGCSLQRVVVFLALSRVIQGRALLLWHTLVPGHSRD